MGNRGNISMVLVASAAFVLALTASLKAIPKIELFKKGFKQRVEHVEALNEKLEALINLSANAPEVAPTVNASLPPHKENGIQWHVETIAASRLKRLTLSFEKKSDVSIVGYRYDDF